MALFAGIDCGTQGTKVVIVDDDSGRILGEGSAPHPLISNAFGRREQQAQWWVDALISAFKRAVDAAAVNPADIQGLALSGQQHGFVALDDADDVLHTVKLWCDTETAPENDWLLEQLGGISGSLARLGLMVATGYTASKIVWFKQHHPELWQRLATVLLPHDYLNFWLTGSAWPNTAMPPAAVCSIFATAVGIASSWITSTAEAGCGGHCRRWSALKPA